MQNSVSIPELGFENSIESFLAPLDQYPDIRVFVKDTDSRYVYANKAYADMLKTTPRRMIPVGPAAPSTMQARLR